ncbi:MAG: substrate-binding domain-containing protein [Cyanobacteria bacterium P01_F01_bin.143]
MNAVRLKFHTNILFMLMSLIAVPVQAQSVSIPEITTEPVVLGRETLKWPTEGGNDLIPPRPSNYPDLTGEANTLDDWHMQTSADDWDLLVSTSGNFYRFLNVFFRQTYLPDNPVVKNGQWGYSTSPPVSIPQLENGGRLTIGNMEIRGLPMVVMGPKPIMNAVIKGGSNDGEPAKMLSNFGNVLLVPAGNPKEIRDIWDLGRDDVRVVTSNPANEAGSFDNYRSSIFHIAFREVEADTGDINAASKEASQLFNQVFNPVNNRDRQKWVVGDRIHHRDLPQALADGDADVGIIFYHLAQTAIEAHPGLFEIVPLGGTVDNPQPLPGNRVATMQAIRIDGNWTRQQIINRDNFFFGITDSTSNSDQLKRFWLREPVTTGNNQPPLP